MAEIDFLFIVKFESRLKTKDSNFESYFFDIIVSKNRQQAVSNFIKNGFYLHTLQF
jgi:hypothetical protein